MKTANQNIISKFLVYIKNERKFSHHTIRAYKYDLNEFIQRFNQWNLMSMVPLERLRKYSAMQGAIQYIKKHSQNSFLFGLWLLPKLLLI